MDSALGVLRSFGKICGGDPSGVSADSTCTWDDDALVLVNVPEELWVDLVLFGGAALVCMVHPID